MRTIQAITFKGCLDFLATLDNPKWHVVFQASQFDPKGFANSVQPVTGMLTLNIGPLATRNMQLQDKHFEFNTKLQGIEYFLQIPYTAVMEFLIPTTGMFMHFPYFLDHGDLDPEDLEIDSSEDDTDDIVLASSLLDKLDTGKLSPNAGFMLGGNFIPTLYNFPKIEVPEPKLSTLEKAGLRNWVVVEGGNKPKHQATMPFIDEVHRAKQQRREEQADMDKFIEQHDLKATAAIRSDGSDGKSAFFPDLDVTKCYFKTKKVERPSWMTVHQGGKQDVA